MTPEQCSAAARAACEQSGNIVTTPNDVACGGSGGGPETNCSNGFDDDGDGNTDCADSDCALNPACLGAGGGGGTESSCTNGVDDDGDDQVDCADGDCAADPACDCENRSGGGDDTNPGGGGNPGGCDNPGGSKKGLGMTPLGL